MSGNMAKRISEQTLNDPVTAHMRRDITRLSLEQTVGQALAWLREHPPEGRIIYFYVVDRDDRLQGVVPTRRLLLSPLERPLADIMVKQVVALPAQATVLDACEFFIQHRFLAFPVVDDERRLLGAVDVELYTEELGALGGDDEGHKFDDLFQLIGVHLAQAQQTTPLAAFRTRFPWLLCNIGGGILAAFLSGIYKEELSRVVALALFIPVVLALAESVAIQSVTLALQTLHGQRPTWGRMFARLRREAGTGVLLGAASGLSVGLVAVAWLRQWGVALCLLAGIAGGVTAAAVLGVTIPTLLRLLRRDPQVAAGPIALALADMATLLLYFNLARWLLT
jgi:magnesium transporter